MPGKNLFIFFLCSFLFLPTVVHGQRTMQNTESNLLQKQKKMRRLKEGLHQQRSLIRSSEKKETSLLADLDRITTQLKNKKKKLDALQQQLSGYETKISLMQADIDILTRKGKKTREHIKKRLAAYYKIGDIGMLNVTFSSKSLPDILNFQGYYQRMLKEDQQTLRYYSTQLQDLQRVKDDLAVQKEAVTTVMTDILNHQQQLTKTKQQRNKLLASIRTEKKLYKRALREIEGAAQELTATIEKIRKKKEDEAKPEKKTIKAPPLKRYRFAEQRGKLSPPLKGKIATFFGRSKKAKFGATLIADGIDISSEEGAAVRAIYHGRVAYVGTLRGYGKLMIIEHGDQYYSLLSRAETFYQKKGDKIISGEIVGVMGDQSGLLNEGLHLEIRHGTTPLDPLKWLDKSKLAVRR